MTKLRLPFLVDAFFVCASMVYLKIMPTLFSPKNINSLRPLIIQAVEEVLSDPDLGLELTEKAKRRLRAARKQNGTTIPFSQIKSKYL